jgi:CheY-like chemotaxis protein
MVWVLVVDDDQPTRDTLRLMLEDTGYAVAEAPDGEAALEMLRSTPYHAVVLFDLLMPIMDGMGFLDQVKADPRLFERHAYILMTANHHTLASTPPGYFDALKVTIVHKPFNVDPLLDIILRAANSLPPDR